MPGSDIPGLEPDAEHTRTEPTPDPSMDRCASIRASIIEWPRRSNH